MAALARAEILRPEPPPGFVHPLVRDAVYQGLPLGERELLHARAARVLRDAGASLDQVAGQLMHTPAARRRRRRAAAARGRAGRGRARRRRQLGRLPAPRARGAAAGRRSGRSCCWTSARSRRSRAAPTARRHLREAYEGLTDVHLRVRAANALGRALLFTSRRPRAPRSPARPRASCRRDGGRGARARGLRADGRRRSARSTRRRCAAADEYRHRPLRHRRREDDGRDRRRWSGRRRAATSTRSSRCRMRALEGGLLQRARPEPADAGRAAADDRRRPRRGAADLRPRDGRRPPPRVAVHDHRDVPVARVHAVLARRPDRRRGAARAPPSTRPRRGATAPTRCNGTPPISPGVSSSAATSPAPAARSLARPERGGHSDGARYWCNARLELLVAEGRYEDAVEAADEYGAPLRPLPQPGRRALELAEGGRARRARDEAQGASSWPPRSSTARAIGARRARWHARCACSGRSRAPRGSSAIEEAVEVAEPRAGAARAGEVARRARRRAPPRRPPRLRPRAAGARPRTGRGVRRRAAAGVDPDRDARRRRRPGRPRSRAAWAR